MSNHVVVPRVYYTWSYKVCHVSDMHSDFVISIRQFEGMQSVVDIRTARRVHRADIQMPERMGTYKFAEGEWKFRFNSYLQSTLLALS